MNLLSELLASLDALDDELAIYAAPPWAPTSCAVAVSEPGDGSVLPGTRGLTYLTSVRSAKHAIATRGQWRPDLMLTARDACEAVIYFARYDEDEPLPSVHSAEIRLPRAI